MFDLLRLRYWNVYFIVALGLHYFGYLQFSIWLNFLFAAFLLIHLPSKLAVPRGIVAGVLAITLLYHESWWPSLDQVFSNAHYLVDFGWRYVAELVVRIIDFKVLAAAAILIVLAWMFRNRFDPTRWVLAALLLPLLPMTSLSLANSGGNYGATGALPDKADLDRKLSEFFAQEDQRKVVFNPLPADEMPYDIIVLHICSLAWADLEYIQQQNHPLLQRFDILFSDFNTVTTYSEPATIHVMRSSCGQSQYGDLYGPPQKECLTFNQLEQAGFSLDLLLNHNGQYGDYLANLRRLGGMRVPLHKLGKVSPYLRFFDESPIANDYEVLSHWWGDRLRTPTPRVALYYNTVSLHDGNRYVSGAHVNEDSMKIYPRRVVTLFDDINKIMDAIEKSGRRAIVVFLPEHGAAIRGDKRQIAGLRDLPSPVITHVPVGIKLIGFQAASEQHSPLVITQPSSYLAVTQLLANFTQRNPFSANRPPLTDYIANLPRTESLSDNDSIFVLRDNNRYYMRERKKSWELYDPS
jgi:cellulose synthase operon protein YhjU